jgi:hypothetical protein
VRCGKLRRSTSRGVSADEIAAPSGFDYPSRVGCAPRRRSRLSPTFAYDFKSHYCNNCASQARETARGASPGGGPRDDCYRGPPQAKMLIWETVRPLPRPFPAHGGALAGLRFGTPVTPALPRSIFRFWEIELSIGAGEGIRTLDPDLGKATPKRQSSVLSAT